mmetsp:Transcript_2996/g.6455  ORF Transcript_2996/g.6455 Transcript_2996/m.6455 type:complete len:202 (+) Transcript_2996:1118-1723(+)
MGSSLPQQLLSILRSQQQPRRQHLQWRCYPQHHLSTLLHFPCFVVGRPRRHRHSTQSHLPVRPRSARRFEVTPAFVALLRSPRALRRSTSSRISPRQPAVAPCSRAAREPARARQESRPPPASRPHLPSKTTRTTAKTAPCLPPARRTSADFFAAPSHAAQHVHSRSHSRRFASTRRAPNQLHQSRSLLFASLRPHLLALR